MGVSLKGGIPKTPQNEENPWLLGTTILGNPHLVDFFFANISFAPGVANSSAASAVVAVGSL